MGGVERIVFDGSDMHDATVWRAIPPQDSLFRHGQHFLQQTLEALYDSLPDTEHCFEGRLGMEERLKALHYVNYIRSLHRLPPVEYDCNADVRMQQTAMAMAANGAIEHYPPTNWRCLTAAAIRGAENSNLYSGSGTGYELPSTGNIIASWLTDEDTENTGHRRWLLDPFVRRIAFGRVDIIRTALEEENKVYAVLDVKTDTSKVIAPAGLEFVAYPFGDYPDILFRPARSASFVVVIQRTSRESNTAVDYSKADIEIHDEHGNSLEISDIHYYNDKCGIPNCLTWVMGGAEDNKLYNVHITSVKVIGETREYSYQFRLTPPSPVFFPSEAAQQ